MTEHHIPPPPMALHKFKTTVTADKFLGVKRDGEYDAQIVSYGVPDRVYVELTGDMNTNGYEGDGDKTSVPVATCKRCFHPLDIDGNSMDDPDTDTADLCLMNEIDDRHFGPHDPEPIPLSWANHASIILEPERDRILVGISVDDPRGAFYLIISREVTGDDCPANCKIESYQLPNTSGEDMDDWDTHHVNRETGEVCAVCDGTGRVNRRHELRMSVPHHTDGTPHMQLTELNSRGYYRLGH